MEAGDAAVTALLSKGNLTSRGRQQWEASASPHRATQNKTEMQVPCTDSAEDGGRVKG